MDKFEPFTKLSQFAQTQMEFASSKHELHREAEKINHLKDFKVHRSRRYHLNRINKVFQDNIKSPRFVDSMVEIRDKIPGWPPISTSTGADGDIEIDGITVSTHCKVMICIVKYLAFY